MAFESLRPRELPARPGPKVPLRETRPLPWIDSLQEIPGALIGLTREQEWQRAEGVVYQLGLGFTRIELELGGP